MTNFIPWAGGEQPVPSLSHVYVTFRDPEFNSEEPVWSQEVDWFHDEGSPEFDITGYRLAEEQPVFLAWFGGENPAVGKTVEIIVRSDQDTVIEHIADTFDWTHDSEDSENDIVFYRVID